MNDLNKIVLVAEDDFDAMEQMKINLKSYGFQVIAVDSQAEAEKIMLTTKPDLAIFDLMMEKQDSGFILSNKLKKLYPEVPIIIATAVGAETGIMFNIETKEDQKWLKADLILEKGIRPDQLFREISKLLKL
jgi:two-component system, OmpR family, response regulator